MCYWVVFIFFCLYGLINKVVMCVDKFNDLDNVIRCGSYWANLFVCGAMYVDNIRT